MGFCLYGILSKLPYESGGGVAGHMLLVEDSTIFRNDTYVHQLRIHDLPSGRSRYLSHT